MLNEKGIVGGPKNLFNDQRITFDPIERMMMTRLY